MGQVFIFVTISKFGALTCSIIGMYCVLLYLGARSIWFGLERSRPTYFVWTEAGVASCFLNRPTGVSFSLTFSKNIFQPFLSIPVFYFRIHRRTVGRILIDVAYIQRGICRCWNVKRWPSCLWMGSCYRCSSPAPNAKHRNVTTKFRPPALVHVSGNGLIYAQVWRGKL